MQPKVIQVVRALAVTLFTCKQIKWFSNKYNCFHSGIFKSVEFVYEKLYFFYLKNRTLDSPSLVSFVSGLKNSLLGPKAFNDSIKWPLTRRIPGCLFN